MGIYAVCGTTVVDGGSWNSAYLAAIARERRLAPIVEGLMQLVQHGSFTVSEAAQVYNLVFSEYGAHLYGTSSSKCLAFMKSVNTKTS